MFFFLCRILWMAFFSNGKISGILSLYLWPHTRRTMDNEVFVHELSFLTLLSALDNLCDTVLLNSNISALLVWPNKKDQRQKLLRIFCVKLLLNSKISALLCCDPNKKDQRQIVLIATYCAVIAGPFSGRIVSSSCNSNNNQSPKTTWTNDYEGIIIISVILSIVRGRYKLRACRISLKSPDWV